MNELSNLCWEQLRSENFAPLGKERWGSWFYNATEKELIALAETLQIPGYGTKVKAIETHFAGRKFRSRLEARWAVYFTAMHIEWEYELNGFALPSGWYLPDFWLPQVSFWAEVKPAALRPPEMIKCQELADGTGQPCLLLEGSPKASTYRATHGREGDLESPQSYFLTSAYLDQRRLGCVDGWEPRAVPADNEIDNAVELALSERFDRKVPA